MKLRVLATTLIFSFCFGKVSASGSSTHPKISKEAQSFYDTVRQAKMFSVGQTGFKGDTSESEKALIQLSNAPNSISIFQYLLKEATTEGKMYGLLGLFRKDKEIYRIELSEYRSLNKESKKLLVQEGCEVFLLTDQEGINKIESGGFWKSQEKGKQP